MKLCLARAGRRLLARGARSLSTRPLSTAIAEPSDLHDVPANGQHLHDPWAPPELAARSNAVDLLSISSSHWDESWDEAAIRAATKAHCGATWTPSAVLDDLPILVKGEGVHLYSADGRKFLDWTSQAVCTNLGYDVPPAVVDAVNKQLTELPHAYSGMAIVEARARLASLLSEMLPGPLTGVLFPSSGSEANEAAIRIARRYTGKHKILTQYRSYHGGSGASLAATGDFRRWYAEASSTGFIKAINPTPMMFSWAEAADASPDEAAHRALAALEEQILLEGPETIAAVLLESIVGSGGAFLAPAEYMRGVRALCDKYGILYIADEVMVGFGRTGHLWGFQHYEGLVPDIVTSAKGLSAAYMPLSMVAMSAELHEHFRTTSVGWGSTYHAHPVALACAYECVKHLLKHDLVGNAARLEPVMRECTDDLVASHPSVRQGRVTGLFGCLDLQGVDGRYMQPLAGPPSPATQPFKRALMAEGIYGLVRPPLLHSAPPLVIDEPTLRDGFARIDRALHVLDAELGF